MPDFVISVRKLKKGAPGGLGAEPGPTRFLEVPDGTDPDRSHEIPRKEWVEKVMVEASSGEKDPVTGHDLGDILVFVHGYNNDPPVVLQRHRLLEKNLGVEGYQGAVVSFDWPSNDLAINYLEDRSDARKTALKLVDDCIRLFTTTQLRGCSLNVHLLAHSTGAYVIRQGFDDADDRRNIASVNWTVSQIAFIGADVSARSMSETDSKATSIYRHCVRLTNYQNPFDSVLKLSNVKRVGVAPRVGRVGLPETAPQKAVNVNCGPHFHKLPEDKSVPGTWAHSWHFGDPGFARDLALTLRGDIDRNFIPTRTLGATGLELIG